MPDTKGQPSVTFADLQAYCNNIPQDHPSFGDVQRYLTQAQQDPTLAANNLTLIQQLVPNPNAQAAQGGDPLQAVGNLIRDRLSQRSFAAVNPATGNAETMTVPVKNVTVDTEMSGGADNKQSLVFRLHVDHKDTVYQAQIAEQAKAVLAEIHPSFKPTPENPAPVRTGSYRDDTHVSLIADVPLGKNPNDVIAEILNPQKAASVPAAASTAVVDQSTNAVNTGPVAAASADHKVVAQGGNLTVTIINGDAPKGDKKFADQVQQQPGGKQVILEKPPLASQVDRLANQQAAANNPEVSLGKSA